jgi:GT2 family glycosyltransferase
MSQDATVVGQEGLTSIGLPSPVLVAVLDVAEPIGDLDCSRPQAPPYTGAWILVCRSGHPLGTIEIPLHGTVIGAAELDRELHAQLGAALAGPPAGPPTGPPVTLVRASVVVPSNFARPAQLRRSVQRLTELDYPDFEVIVVDNRPADAPPVDIPGARVVREPRPGISAARNRGIAAATGEIIAFTDDDVVADRRWLRVLGERFARQPDLAVVTGLVAPLELETPAQVLFEQSHSALERGFVPLTFERAGAFRVRRRAPGAGKDQLRSLYKTGELGLGSNMAFRTSVLRAAGGFDRALGTGTPARAGEDLAMFVELLAAGHRLGYEPDAIIQHSHRDTMEELERQVHGYGIGLTAMLIAVTLRHPRHALGLAAIVPKWLLSLRDPGSVKQAHRAEDYPPALARAELRGMLAGPFAYLRSRRSQRRWAR